MRVRTGIQEYRNPIPAVGFNLDGDVGKNHSEHHKTQSLREFSASDQIEQAGASDEHRQSPDIFLHNQKHAYRSDHQRKRRRAVGDARDFFAPRVKPRGKIDDKRQLERLRGLETQRPEAQPAPRAAGGVAQLREKNERQEHEGAEHQGNREFPPTAIVDCLRNQEGADAARERVDKVADRVVGDRAEVLLGNAHGCRGDNENASREEKQRGPEQGFVERMGWTKHRLFDFFYLVYKLIAAIEFVEKQSETRGARAQQDVISGAGHPPRSVHRLIH